MSKHSILLALSGSEQSRNAAELSWKIAKQLKAEVIAEHIIDSAYLWEFYRNDKPGFIGSGPYISAYEATLAAMRTTAEKLLLSYESHANGQGIAGDNFYKEGNPIEILTEDAKGCSLLVMGHNPHGERRTKAHQSHSRYSLAEGIAHLSTTPLLIVQSNPVEWRSITVVSEIDHLNLKYIHSCLRLAELLGLPARLEFWGSGSREEKPAQIKKNILDLLPESERSTFEFAFFGGQALKQRKDFFQRRDLTKALTAPGDTLFVLPTRRLASETISVFGMEPEDFIRSLALPCILLWPEEQNAFDTNDINGKPLSTSNT